MNFRERYTKMNQEYGDLVRLKGFDGKEDICVSFNPDHFETVVFYFKVLQKCGELYEKSHLKYHCRSSETMAPRQEGIYSTRYDITEQKSIQKYIRIILEY